MANADISLLFGVLGEGSLGGESGKLIQSQLTQLMAELNKNPLKVKVGIDADAGGKKSWNGQLQDRLNRLSESGKFSVQISNLKLSSGAISDFKKQLSAVVNTLGLSTGTEITISSKGIGEIKKDLQDTGDAATDAAHKIAEFKVQMEALSGQKSSIKKSIDDLAKTTTSDEERARIAELTAQYEQWAIKIEEVKAAKAAIPADQRAAIEAESSAILTNIDRLNAERIAREDAARAAADAAKTQKSASEESARAQDTLIAGSEGYRNALNKINTALIQAKNSQKKWTAALTGKTSSDYKNIAQQIEALEELKHKLDSSTLSAEKFREEFGAATAEIRNSSEHIRAMGENTGALSSRIGTLAQKFSAWLSVSQVIMLGVRSIRKMVTATIELDDAMTQLKIVTRTTEDAYDSYMNTISKTAKRIGSSITDLVSSTTTYARLGYSLDESSALAEFTAMLQNVGDIDVADAQDALTAIVKAFGISVDEIESIMDKLVITGNNFPISVAQIAEGMNNASSALAAAGNTFDQSVALMTAANTTIQNAAKSSTGLRTIAARLRSTKTELDELGEAMTEAEYGDLVAALTKYNVALTDANGEFRSTYDIVADIAAMWDKLSTTEQAALANAIAGVRQQSVFFSMVEQFQEASGAMEDMANSAGTLRESYATYMESTTAHINQFKATFQSLSQATFSTDFLNDIIDFGTKLLGIVETIMRLIGVLGGLNTVMSAAVGIVATINAEALVGVLSKVAGGIVMAIPNLALFISKFAELPAAMRIAKAEGKGLSAALDLIGISASTAQIAVGALTAVLVACIAIYQHHNRVVEENNQKMNEAADAANKERESLSSLIEEYKRLANEGKFDEGSRETVRNLQQQITDLVGDQADNLDLVNGKLDDQIQKLSEIAYKTAQDNSGSFETKLLDAERKFNDGVKNTTSALNPLVPNQGALNTAIKDLYQNHDVQLNSDWFKGKYVGFDAHIDVKNAQEVLDTYKELQRVLLDNKDLWADTVEDSLTTSQEQLLNDVQSQIETYQDIVNTFHQAQSDYFENEAIIEQFEYLKKNTVDTQEAFNAYVDGIRNSTEYSNEYKDILLQLAGKSFPQFAESAGLVESAMESSENSIGHYNNEAAELSDSLSALPETITSLRSAYDLLKTAQDEMASGDGLSADTIKALADAEENYLDYLYEENGIIKLNTEAWKENAQQKAETGTTDEIRKEIDSIKARNVGLQQSIAYYKEQRKLGNDGGIWTDLISQAESELESNNNQLEQSAELLRIVEVIFGNVAENVDSFYTSLSSVKSAMSELASAYNELNESGSVSYSTLSQIADAYGRLVPNIDNYIGRLAEAKGNAEDTAQAMTELIDALIKSRLSTDDLANADENVIAAMLEEAGVANAAEHAHWLVVDAKAKNIIASYDLANATDAETTALLNAIQGLLGEGDAAQFAEKYVAALRIEQILTNQNPLDSTASVNSLIEIASAAGASTTALSKLAHAKEAIASGSVEGFRLIDQMGDIEAAAVAEAQSIASSLKSAVSSAFVGVSSYKFKPSSSSKSSSSDSSNEVEEYTAELDALYKKLQAIQRIEEDIERENAKAGLLDDDDFDARIEHHKSLVQMYEKEQTALHALAESRRELISTNLQTLSDRGFEYDYDADNNTILIHNMERINELSATTKGQYDTLQEATNALRKETEDLIGTTTSMVEANRENSDSWWELSNAIREAKIAIVDALRQIVTDASDAVDEIQNVYNTLKAAADEYAENGGFISVDAFQSIIELGPQYMQYLRDENGLLVINEENINRVIIAKTRQLAAEQALTYVERLRLALQEGSVENLNTLLYATTEATDATFGLAYAELALMHSMGDLDDQQYAAALHNIQSIESLANTAIASVGQVAGESSEKVREELEKMKSGLDDILKYVMDMLKHRIQQQIDALEALKDAYGDIIDLRKEALDAAKEEADYEDKVAEKVKQIAKLQERINALSLDDSRDAQAQKIKLEEEMAEIQKELADDQNDYAVDAQKDALDDMKDAYEDEKDAEIAALEETISSYQKLYDMAIDYIESHWNTLYDELISWNTEYGSVLNSEITEAWNNCLAAAQRYGSYVSALNSIDADISAAGSTSTTGGVTNNTIVGNSSHSQASKEDSIHAIVKEMYSNSQEHHTASKERKAWLDNRNLQLGTMLAQYGVNTHRDNGTWYIDGSKQLLYDKYKRYIYHKGGIAGDNPTLKQNEIMAVLEKGEAVLDEQKERGLYRLVEFATTLSDKFSELIRSSGLSNALTGPGGMADVKPDAPPSVTNSEKVSIEFGDTIIYGANEDTVEQHRAITRQQANELLDKLNIKR